MKVVVKKKLKKVPTRFNPSCTTTTHPSTQRLLTKSQSFLRETMKHLLAWVSHCWLSQYCTALTVASESHVLKRQDVSNLVIQGGWLPGYGCTNSLLTDDQTEVHSYIPTRSIYILLMPKPLISCLK